MCVSKKIKKKIGIQIFSLAWSDTSKGSFQYFKGQPRKNDNSSFIRVKKVDLFCDSRLEQAFGHDVYKSGLVFSSKQDFMKGSIFILGKLSFLYSKEIDVFSQITENTIDRYNRFHVFFDSHHLKFLTLIKCSIKQ